jgi:hypothetical protein
LGAHSLSVESGNEKRFSGIKKKKTTTKTTRASLLTKYQRVNSLSIIKIHRPIPVYIM